MQLDLSFLIGTLIALMISFVSLNAALVLPIGGVISNDPDIDLGQYPTKSCFDYSTNNGVVRVSFNEISFPLMFGAAGKNAIYIYSDALGHGGAIGHRRRVLPGKTVTFEDFEHTSRVYMFSKGSYFMARNAEGYYLLGRILSVKYQASDDAAGGDENNEVCFGYSINSDRSSKFNAM